MLRAEKDEDLGRQNQECSNNNDHSHVHAGDRALRSHLTLTSTLCDGVRYPILWIRKLGSKDTKLAHDKPRKHKSLYKATVRKSLPAQFLQTKCPAGQSGDSQCVRHWLPGLSNHCRVHLQADSHSWLYAMRKQDPRMSQDGMTLLLEYAHSPRSQPTWTGSFLSLLTSSPSFTCTYKYQPAFPRFREHLLPGRYPSHLSIAPEHLETESLFHHFITSSAPNSEANCNGPLPYFPNSHTFLEPQNMNQTATHTGISTIIWLESSPSLP